MCRMGLIKTADMHYTLIGDIYEVVLGGDLPHQNDVPAWSASQLFELLPKQIPLPPLECDDEDRGRCAALQISFTSEGSILYGYLYGFISNEDENEGWLYVNESGNMVHALYDLVCYCYNNNIKLKTNDSSDAEME